MTNISYTRVRAVFFDVAHTLLYKPDLYITISKVLESHHLLVDLNKLILVHKLYSETVEFPDKTSTEFYQKFNREFLYLLGIIPTPKMLDEIFQACHSLQWTKYEDTSILEVIKQPIGILSNWDVSLERNLICNFDVRFRWIIGSQKEKIKKPETLFFQKILDITGLKPSNILYVGDSVKLDIEPALKLGMNTFLIDRYNWYSGSNISRLTSLMELSRYL